MRKPGNRVIILVDSLFGISDDMIKLAKLVVIDGICGVVLDGACQLSDFFDKFILFFQHLV